MSTSKKFAFTRRQRLLTAKHFDTVFNNRDIVQHNSGFTYFIRKSSNNTPRIGFVLAKKKIKHAVSRNKVRRLHRENFRQMQHLLPPCDIVVLAKNQAVKFTTPELNAMIKKTLIHIQRKLLEYNQSSD